MSKPLLNDLQELINAGIITSDSADRIRQYYQNKKEPPNTRFNIVLAILGSLLVSLGIVLLVAHNWDEMPRDVQTIFAFLPLALGQGLCVFTLLKKKEIGPGGKVVRLFYFLLLHPAWHLSARYIILQDHWKNLS